MVRWKDISVIRGNSTSGSRQMCCNRRHEPSAHSLRQAVPALRCTVRAKALRRWPPPSQPLLPWSSPLVLHASPPWPPPCQIRWQRGLCRWRPWRAAAARVVMVVVSGRWLGSGGTRRLGVAREVTTSGSLSSSSRRFRRRSTTFLITTTTLVTAAFTAVVAAVLGRHSLFK